jgi:NADPH-dependent 2,4-dienoyl-CoA reductase/sulfur reductase-like enzyme
MMNKGVHMPQFKYLIIGGGMTADSARAGIREVDANGSIGMIGAEAHPPYDRPPLSKGMWKGKPLEKIFRQTSEDVQVFLGKSVVSINPEEKRVEDDQGEGYSYEKLLLATGGTPRKLPFGGEDVIYFRTLDDFKRLYELSESKARFAVIGGGFIGSEIASALANRDQEVLMAFPEEGIGSLIFPPDLALYLNNYYRQNGVDVLAGELVSGIEKRGDKMALTTKSGQEHLVDHVVAGIGIIPNTSLAEASGIQVENGVVVDEHMRTNKADIYAAGDVANFYSPVLDMRLRVEHEDNALTSGSIAGRNMAGEAVPYEHLSMFYSDLFELGYEAVGELNPKLETYSDWQDPFQKGVVYYLDEGRVRGVLLWNVWGQVDQARDLIADPGPFTAENLKGRFSG